MAKAVFGMVNTRDHAGLIKNHLKAAGFPEERISVLAADHKEGLDFKHVLRTKAPEGVTAGASAGGILGGGLGWIAGLGMLAIPGAAPLAAAGPLLAGLSGAALGATVGGVAGALVGLGMPEFEAKLYEGQVKAGGVLLAVQTRDGEEARRAKDVLEEAGAHDIRSAEPVTVRPVRRERRAQAHPAA